MILSAMVESEPVIQARNVSKTFGAVRVLNRLNLSFVAGEITLLLGANGAGKSTLLRILAGLARADSGSIDRTTRRIGFLSHQSFLYSRLTVAENIKLFSEVTERQQVEPILSRWGLSASAKILVGDLSRGTQARVGLARAFLASPEVLLLDEPSSNLDERGTELLLTAMRDERERAGSKLVSIVATHDLHRLRSIADRIVVLSAGEVLADTGSKATPDDIDRIVGFYREANR